MFGLGSGMFSSAQGGVDPVKILIIALVAFHPGAEPGSRVVISVDILTSTSLRCAGGW